MFVANRRRERAIELAQRFGGASGSFDALPDELDARRHRGRLDLLAAPAPRRRGARRSSPATGAGRPLLLIDLAVPRDIDPACAELPGVTLLDIDGLQRQVRRHQLGPAGRGAQGRGHRRGGDPGVRGLARLARGDADADRAARRAPTTVVDAGCWPRTRAAGSRSSERRPRARREAARTRGRQAAAARADACASQGSTPSTATRGCSCCASCSGSTKPAAAEAAPSGPPRSARCGPR